MTSIDVLVAVHHPLRRRIFDYLHLNGPSQVGTLARVCDEQVGSISHHLRMLERAGVVERAPEMAEMVADRRTSWWRTARTSIDWAADDFVSPADRARAKAAERLNTEHHLRKLSGFHRISQRYDEDWRRAAFSSDSLGHATSDELADLGRRLAATVREWRDGIDPDDGQEREPVFVFAHGFPTQP